MAVNRLEEHGCVGKMAKANSSGFVSSDSVLNEMTPRTALVSMSWANGLTGVINPVGEISTICQERGVKLHLDATHILGKLYFDLNDIGADYITFGGDVLHAPKGTGGLYIKSGGKCRALIRRQTNGARPVLLMFPPLQPSDRLAKEALDARDLLCTEVARLRDRFESGIADGFSDAFFAFQKMERLPHCTTIAFPGIANEALLYALNRKNIFASIGEAASSRLV